MTRAEAVRRSSSSGRRSRRRRGAQARIQLELVLIKAAAPEVESSAALMARISRLEAGSRGA